MKKVEAPTLEEAYQRASQMLGCSVSELQSEVIQHPSKGFFGLLKKNAIIVATCKQTASKHAKNEVKKEAVDVPTAEDRGRLLGQRHPSAPALRASPSRR